MQHHLLTVTKLYGNQILTQAYYTENYFQKQSD